MNRKNHGWSVKRKKNTTGKSQGTFEQKRKLYNKIYYDKNRQMINMNSRRLIMTRNRNKLQKFSNNYGDLKNKFDSLIEENDKLKLSNNCWNDFAMETEYNNNMMEIDKSNENYSNTHDTFDDFFNNFNNIKSKFNYTSWIRILFINLRKYTSSKQISNMVKDVVELIFELLCAMSSNMDEQLCNNLKNFLSCLDEILPSSSTVKKWCTYYSKLITTMHSACLFVESRNMIQSFNCDGSRIKGISFEAFMLTTRSTAN